jgi:hypothetical protein
MNPPSAEANDGIPLGKHTALYFAATPRTAASPGMKSPTGFIGI